MSSQMVTDAARERLEEQKRSAARDFLKSAVMPLIEDVLVKKFCQTMDVIAEENKRLKAREEGLVEAMEGIRQYGSDTLSGRVGGTDDRAWQRAAVSEMTKRAKSALAAHRKQGGDEA